MQGIKVQIFSEFFHGFLGGNELAAGRKIYSVVAWITMRRTGHPHVYPFYAQLAQCLYAGFNRRAPDDGIFDNDNILTF